MLKFTIEVISVKQKRRVLEILFSNKHLQILYEKGNSKKYRLDKSVLENFFEVVAILEAARDIYDLWLQPSLNFEKLTGFENRFSARLNRKWRLEMTINWTDEKMTIGIIDLEDISSHYGG